MYTSGYPLYKRTSQNPGLDTLNMGRSQRNVSHLNALESEFVIILGFFWRFSNEIFPFHPSTFYFFWILRRACCTTGNSIQLFLSTLPENNIWILTLCLILFQDAQMHAFYSDTKILCLNPFLRTVNVIIADISLHPCTSEWLKSF